MLPLSERLAAVVKILVDDNWILEQDTQADGTGFVACKPDLIALAAERLTNVMPPPHTVLDLGCGNGGFAILAAAAGYDAYGIEINELVLEHARQNFAHAKEQGLIVGSCVFALGDMIPIKDRDAYRKFREIHDENAISMPQSEKPENIYDGLGTNIEMADIIYCWAWPTQSRFIYNMLQDEAKEDCVFILPNYIRYTQGEHMNAFFKETNRLVLFEFVPAAKDVFVGRRTA